MNETQKKPQKKKLLLIAAAAVGVILMLLPHFIPENEEETQEGGGGEIVYYSEKIEEKIEELISSAQGVGNANVVVTLDGTGEYVWAQNETVSEKSTAAEYVIVNGADGEEPVLISEIYPKIRGVAVVCDGGGNSEVKNRVIELISAALGISANKIAVSG